MTNLLTAIPVEFCAATNACEEGREFARRHATMAEVWDACPRPDWLLWIARKVDRVPDHRTLRLFAVWCARNTPLEDGRVTGDLITDPRSLAALETAERHAHGQASDAELTYAAYAAYAAVRHAYDAAIFAAAYAAVRAAADAAVRAAADAAVRAAAAAAVHAADAATRTALAAYATAHADAACADAADVANAASLAQADQFRRMVPNPFRP